jgi:hypothetical protein
MTGSGSTPFQGESNLQFDGSKLAVTGKVTINQQSLSISSGSLSWSLTSGANASVTLNQNVTTFTLSNFTTGDSGVLVVKQDGTGGRTMVLPSNSQVVGGGTYTPTSAANSNDVLGVYFDGTFYYWTIGLASVTGNLITITNNADDRILTATGSSTSINGETGLTYNGSTLAVTGAITATGDITAYSSDQRLKENVINIPNALDKILSLNGVTYDWNEKALSFGFVPTNRKHDVGLIAQQVESVLPEAIAPAPFDTDQTTGESISGENYLTVRYDKLVALLIEGMKEQQKEINELKKLYKS